MIQLIINLYRIITQVSRAATKEEFGRLRIDATEQPISKYYNNPKYIDSKEYYAQKIEQYKDFKDRYNKLI